jgi:hypothetical protein
MIGRCMRHGSTSGTLGAALASLYGAAATTDAVEYECSDCVRYGRPSILVRCTAHASSRVSKCSRGRGLSDLG